jgi:hypothetical protein
MTLGGFVVILPSIVGGGLIGAVVNWISSSRAARRAREADFIRDQLRLLYGPLFFFTSQNDELFKLAGNVQDVRRAIFEDKNWSTDEHTQAALGQQHMATIEMANAYVERVVKNNERIMDILENNWHVVDSGDIEVLSRFRVDYTRYLVEVMGPGKKDVPLSVVRQLGPIPFIRPDFIACVRTTFERLRERLMKLTGVDSRPTWALRFASASAGCMRGAMRQVGRALRRS